ncbi:helicase-related protein [Anaeromyxobacter sp. SG66]|uniref:helicase-related protein n=1 Tax=Anaeromyxobacter sp. SG66 TaxID=2925410 RepID=UPI001F57EC72|nr:helicase-related protein [Anaeromyxobacter sp. SG66]
MAQAQFSPGNLVRARGREWIVLVGSDAETLKLRPVSGSEEDQTLLYLPLEREPVTPATFPYPAAAQLGGQDAAVLLRDALLLSLRRGAGPFRSFGQLAVEPRAYQLVPLLMALKQPTVRLLIADDVGIGKTVEAALIARELLDRGEVERFTVLCPPHLVEQWTAELENRFNLRAAPVTAASAGRLERGLPIGTSIFTAHPFTVVSLDYIKSERRRADFLRACPELVVVDEAHTCASTGAGRHQRHALLKALAESGRHLVLLTATPHSGDDEAFYRLLGLLDPSFERLKELAGAERDRLRERLALHFVQRRRPDIAEWKEGNLFPRRETKELTYQLTGAWNRFFEDVLDYCASVVSAAGGDEKRQRLSFWGTLALMRCVASSPAAAAQALRTRAGLDAGEDEEALQERLFDGASDALSEDDVEPPAASEAAVLGDLIAQAERLSGQSGDPKLKLLTDHLQELLTDGFAPVVFCRYIATAHYLGEHLKDRFKGVTVGVVTGELASEERKDKVEQLGDAERRLLIATDCLSEGINLQEHFDAVVHYDLSWNPTRHEQREGRVDRFGQQSKVVRATLLYGANNPVDGAVLEVILRKAEKIRQELGVPVPLPDEGHTLTQALMKAVLLRHAKGGRQRVLDFSETPEATRLDRSWTDAAERAKANRTVFAQRRLKPEEVLPEWKKTLEAMGGAEDVKRFTHRALSRLGSGLEELRRGAHKAALATLPEDVRERLEAEGITGAPLVSFGYPPAPRCRPIQRSHPLVSILAETLLERTLADAAHGNGDGKQDASVLGRTGCWVSDAVKERTTVAILRLRHQLTEHRGGKASTLLVEEAAALGWAGAQSPRVVEGLDALTLLVPPPAADPPANVTSRAVAQALELLAARAGELDAFARRRADALLADHRRVRSAAEATGRYAVHALLPADVIGLFVLLPKVS